MSKKTMTAVAMKAAKIEEKAKAQEKAMEAAVIESARIREMFEEDRKALARRYGVLSSR